jgi:hypothetical protein
VTSPRFRRHRNPDGRRPDFTGDGRDITQALQDAGPPDWDGTTMPLSALRSQPRYTPAVTPAEDYRQAIAHAGAEPGNPPGSGYFSGIGPGAVTWHPGQYPPDPGPAAAPLAMLRARPHGPDMFPALPGPPPAPVGYEVTGRETGRGWPHLFELRCAYPAALAETPIPCDSVHRDAGALSFRALRRSAQAAGWHMDRLEQWVCPRCCQVNPEYRTLYSVTLYDIQAAEAYVSGDWLGSAADWLEQDDCPPDSEYGEWVAAAGVEVAARASAEHDLFRCARDVARRGRHAAVTR